MSLIKKRNPKKVWYEVCFDIKEKTPTKVIDFQRFVEVIFTVVGKTGFEPATPWSQTRCEHKSYTLIYNALSVFLTILKS